jgi:superfamily I DNA/RNA helicase
MSRFRLYDLNPEQQSAATHENGPLLILAGAGTGKTRTIVARITWLVSTGTPASKILAVTFTNKAAREMKERIRGMLNEEQADEITAYTFHALCVRILRADADKIGYKNNFTIFDEGDQLGLIKKVIIHRQWARATGAAERFRRGRSDPRERPHATCRSTPPGKFFD